MVQFSYAELVLVQSLYISMYLPAACPGMWSCKWLRHFWGSTTFALVVSLMPPRAEQERQNLKQLRVSLLPQQDLPSAGKSQAQWTRELSPPCSASVHTACYTSSQLSRFISSTRVSTKADSPHLTHTVHSHSLRFSTHHYTVVKKPFHLLAVSRSKYDALHTCKV